MKYLQDYMEDKQTALFEEVGVFFAFSRKQFYEQRKEGVEYASLPGGMICPKGKGVEVINRLHEIFEERVKQDIEENGITAIIHRELDNHECGYTGDIDACAEALEGYQGITRDMIKAEFGKKYNRTYWGA